jgi:hypothetical protein
MNAIDPRPISVLALEADGIIVRVSLVNVVGLEGEQTPLCGAGVRVRLLSVWF